MQPKRSDCDVRTQQLGMKNGKLDEVKLKVWLLMDEAGELGEWQRALDVHAKELESTKRSLTKDADIITVEIVCSWSRSRCGLQSVTVRRSCETSSSSCVLVTLRYFVRRHQAIQIDLMLPILMRNCLKSSWPALCSSR